MKVVTSSSLSLSVATTVGAAGTSFATHAATLTFRCRHSDSRSLSGCALAAAHILRMYQQPATRYSQGCSRLARPISGGSLCLRWIRTRLAQSRSNLHRGRAVRILARALLVVHHRSGRRSEGVLGAVREESGRTSRSSRWDDHGHGRGKSGWRRW